MRPQGSLKPRCRAETFSMAQNLQGLHKLPSLQAELGAGKQILRRRPCLHGHRMKFKRRPIVSGWLMNSTGSNFSA